MAKQGSGYDERVRELEQKKEGELEDLKQRISNEQTSQTSELRSAIKQLSEKEYTLGVESLVLDLGTYNIEKELFPISLKNKTTLPTSVVRVAMNGTLPMPKDAARKFKQEWQSGLVRPVVTVRAGSKEVTKAEIVDDVDNNRLVNYEGEFLPAKRVEKLEKGERFSLKDGIIVDLKTMLE